MTPELKKKIATLNFWNRNRALKPLLITFFLLAAILLQLETGIFIK